MSNFENDKKHQKLGQDRPYSKVGGRNRGDLTQGVKREFSRAVMAKNSNKGASKSAVMKVTTRHKTISTVKSNLEYISRNGQVELEFSDGSTANGKTAATVGMAKLDDRLGWKTKAIGLVISSPSGTDSEVWKKVAREWGEKNFGDVGAYAFAVHTDTNNPHAHFLIGAKTYARTQLQIDREDIARMRSSLAEIARENGIELTSINRAEKGKSPALESRNHFEKQILKNGDLPDRMRKKLYLAVGADIQGVEMPDKDSTAKEAQRIKKLHVEIASGYAEAGQKNPKFKAAFEERIAVHSKEAELVRQQKSPMEALLKAGKDAVFNSSGTDSPSAFGRAYTQAIVDWTKEGKEREEWSNMVKNATTNNVLRLVIDRQQIAER